MANCTPILVETGLITKEEVNQWPPYKIFPSCVEVLCYLARLKTISK